MKIILYPRMFNHLVSIGKIKSDYLINVDISKEKDELLKENKEIIKILKMYKDQCDYYSDSLASSWWDVYNEAAPYLKGN